MANASYGVTLCKKSNTAVAVMNKIVGGTPTITNNNWSVAMTDGNTVRGLSVCSTVAGSGFAVVNTAVADTADSGVHCHCKMMAPAASYWVFANEYADNTTCAAGCATLCGNYMAGTASGCAASVTMDDESTDDCLKFRSATYEAIW